MSVTVPTGEAAPAILEAHAAVNSDYAWTEAPATEAFFLLLSVLVLPYAAWRLLRRLRR